MEAVIFNWDYGGTSHKKVSAGVCMCVCFGIGELSSSLEISVCQVGLCIAAAGKHM